MTSRTKSLLRFGLVALLGIGLLIGAINTLVALSANTPEKAERNIREYLRSHHPDISENLIAGPVPLNHRAWIVHLSTNTRPSVRPEFCLIDREGDVHRGTAHSLSKVMREEFQPNANDPKHLEFIERFRTLLHHERSVILTEQNRGQPLRHKPYTPKIDRQIRDPRHLADGTYIFFTYQFLGGIVRRYEFSYDPEGNFEEATAEELANRMGSAGSHD